MFKSLTVFQATQAVPAILRAIEEKLPTRTFTPCGQNQEATAGWVPPLGDDTEELAYTTQGATLFCLRTDTKVVPAGAVKLAVKARTTEFEKEKGEPASPVDKRVFKEEITESMLPNAIAAPSWTYAYLDATLGMLFVGASDSDHFIAELKKTLGGVPVKLLELGEVDPCQKMTGWLRDSETLGEAFKLGDACSMKAPKEGGTAVVNISHEDLESEYIEKMIEDGAECCRIGLMHEAADFAITAKLGLRRLSIDAEDEDGDGDEPAQDMVYQFVGVVNAVRQIMGGLEPLFGGWPTQELLDLHDEQEAVA